MSNQDAEIVVEVATSKIPAAATPEEVRQMDEEQLKSYVSAVAPVHNALMEKAEDIMVKARPLNENLYVARTRLAEMGKFAG